MSTYEYQIDHSRPANVAALKLRHIVWQFRKDVFDKEVQSAATYSYMWLADQMGHIGVGILLTIVPGLVVLLYPGLVTGVWRVLWPFLVAIAICASWEVGAFFAFYSKTTNRFAKDGASLAANAAVATLYMAMGVAIGVSWQCALLYPDADLNGWAWAAIGIGVTLFCTAAALVIAYSWVRQKIIWQKAGMPFLFRLANVDPHTVTEDIANDIKGYLSQYLKKETVGQSPPLVISGPLSAGKTSLACGIGTEAAFANLTVRYVTFDKLGEMGAYQPEHDDPGPPNILYWKWKKCDVLIIDDVNSGFVDSETTALSEFEKAARGLKGRFDDKITIWILGPKLDDAKYGEWANTIQGLYTRADATRVVRVHLGGPAGWPNGWFGRTVNWVRARIGKQSA